MNICPDCNGLLEIIEDLDDSIFKCEDCGKEFEMEDICENLDDEVYNRENDPMNWEDNDGS
jgi:DNA-directed RNA polymerase subunit M/transcription elongation factor TFIIS